MNPTNRPAAPFCAAAAALVLSGCATNIPLVGTDEVAGGVEREAVAYNRIQKDATLSIILENILQSRDRGVVAYSTISGITSTPEVTVSAEGNFTPLGLGNPPGPFMGSSAKIGQGTKSGANYSVTPLAQSDSSASVGILAPTPADVVINYWNANWPRDVLISLFVHTVRWKDANGEQVLLSDPENPGEFLTRLEASPLGPRKNWGRLFFETPDANCEPVPEKLVAQAIGRPAASEKAIVELLPSLNERSGKVYKVDVDPKKNAVIYNRCRNTSERTLVRRDNGKPVELDVSFSYRSFDSIVYYVGEMLRLGDEKARFLRDMDCNGDNKGYAAALFKVYESGNRKGESFDVRAKHLGATYFAVPHELPGVCYNERTGTVMTILSQLFLLNQDKKFLEAPEILLRN